MKCLVGALRATQPKKPGRCMSDSWGPSSDNGGERRSVLPPGLKRLALAVVKQAVEDAGLDPTALTHRMQDAGRRTDARQNAFDLLEWHEDAWEFLSGEESTLWLTILDVNPEEFRRQWREREDVRLCGPE